MRHGHGYRKLGRECSHRRALLRNLATSLLEHGRIETTLPKAKELRGIVERLITLGKRGGLHARRQVDSYVFGHSVGRKVCTELAGRFQDRPGGYTRIIRYGARFGDGALMCSIELVDYSDSEGASSLARKAARTAAKVAAREKADSLPALG